MNSCEIRRAGLADVDALLDLWRRAEATPSVTDTPDDIARAVEAATTIVLIAVAPDGTVAGSVIATFDGWRGNLYRVAVDPQWRRRRLAARLVAEAEDWLRTAGARRVSALVEGHRDDAQAFWSAVGFAPHHGMQRYTKTV